MINMINKLGNTNFNLSTSIFVVIFACLVVILAAIQLYYNCSTSKYLIFKKQKPADKVFIINLIAFILIVIVASIISAFCANEERYLPYALILWILSGILLGLIINYFVFNFKFNKRKYSVNQFLDINYKTIKSNFDLDGLSFQNKDYFLNKNKNFDKQLIEDYEKLLKNINDYEKSNSPIDLLIADVIIFEEKYCVSLSKKKRRCAFALFLDLANELKKISIQKIKK